MKKRSLLFLVLLALMALGMLLTGCRLEPETDSPAEVDKTALWARIQYVERNFADNADQTYTDASFSELQNALQSAKTVNENSDATKEQVDGALTNLNAAIDGLERTFERAYNLDQLSEFIAGIGFNYTLNVTDYSGSEKAEYQAYYTEQARYYGKTECGFASYDGYVHTWSYDASGNVKMGGVYFKADASPMVYLYGEEMHRIIRSLGNIEEYEIWGSASFANLKNTNVYVSTEENYVEAFTELATGSQLDASLAERIGGVAVEIIKDGETDVLAVTLYGEHYLDPVIQYTVTNVGATSLQSLEAYISEHPDYQSVYSADQLLEKYYDLYDWEDALKFHVYTTSEGILSGTPDYVITSVNMDNSYWHSTKGNHALLNLAGVKLNEATFENGHLAVGEQTAFNRFAISFYTYCIEKRELYVNAEGTDEWFIDLAQNPGVKDFAVRFFDVEEADAALISKISVGMNEEGNLVMTLWKAHSGLREWDGVILRAVLAESTYQGNAVAVEAIEHYFETLESREALAETVETAKEIPSNRYTAESYALLQQAIAQAEAIVENSASTSEDISNANVQITLAIQNLVLLPSQQDVAELENLLIRAGFYTASYYTTESYTALRDAVKAAEELLKKQDAQASEIQAQLANLENAVNGLEKVADKSELNAALQQMKDMSLNGYTAVSAGKFQTALSAAQTVAGKDGCTQEDVDDALDALTEAYQNLEQKASSKDALQAAYDAVKAISNDGKYTDESFAALDAVRQKAEQALADDDLSEILCRSLTKMLNNRALELEPVTFATNGTDAKSIQKWIDNTFCDGFGEYMGIAVSGYSFTVKYADGSEKTFISKVGKYFYNVTDNEGYIKIEKQIHGFRIESGKVILGDACFNRAGTYMATYFSHIGISDVGYLKASMTRIGNSNEWFATQTSWISFVPQITGAYGFGLTLEDGALTVRVYGGYDAISGNAAANRTDVLATVTFDKIGSASLKEADDLLGSENPRVSADDVVAVLQKLQNNYTVLQLSTGARIIRTETYYLNGESGYILKDGAVHQLFFIEGKYRLGGTVYVDGKAATSLDQVLTSVEPLKALTAQQLQLFYNDWYEEYVNASYYLVIGSDGKYDDAIAELMAKLAGVEPEDGELPELSISVTGYGCVCIVVGDMTVRADDFYIFTEAGSTSVAEIEALI